LPVIKINNDVSEKFKVDNIVEGITSYWNKCREIVGKKFQRRSPLSKTIPTLP